MAKKKQDVDFGERNPVGDWPQYWIDPSGKVYDATSCGGHDMWIAENRDLLLEKYKIPGLTEDLILDEPDFAIDEMRMLSNGWVQVGLYKGEMSVHTGTRDGVRRCLDLMFELKPKIISVEIGNDSSDYNTYTQEEFLDKYGRRMTDKIYKQAISLFVRDELDVHEEPLVSAVIAEIGDKYDYFIAKRKSADKIGLYDKDSGKCIGLYGSEADIIKRYKYEISVQAGLDRCPDCGRYTITTKVYTDKAGVRRRLRYCIAKGCGHSHELPFSEDYISGRVKPDDQTIFYKGETEDGLGVGQGNLGSGVYITEKEGMAEVFAEECGGMVHAYRLKPGLKLLSAGSKEFIDVKLKYGLNYWGAPPFPKLSDKIAEDIRAMGYDGVVSDDIATGTVIFDRENLIPAEMPKKEAGTKKYDIDALSALARAVTDNYSQKWGDCYVVNSTVAYWLNNHLGEGTVEILQGTAFLDKSVRDTINGKRVSTKEPDHIVVGVVGGGDEGWLDFSNVFHGAEILSFESYDTLGGKMDRELYDLLEAKLRETCDQTKQAMAIPSYLAPHVTKQNISGIIREAYADTEEDDEGNAGVSYKDVLGAIIQELGNFSGRIPIYRAVGAKDLTSVRTTQYDVGESWSYSLDAAKHFGYQNATPPLFMIKAYVNQADVDWEQTVDVFVYNTYMVMGSGDEEREIKINPSADLQNITVEPLKKATPIARKYHGLKKAKIELMSDQMRMDYLKSAKDAPVSRGDVNRNELLDADDWVVAKNNGDKIVYYEYWGTPCWNALYQKAEYKGLSREEAIEKFIAERFSIIAAEIGETVLNHVFAGGILRVEVSNSSQRQKKTANNWVEAFPETPESKMWLHNKIQEWAAQDGGVASLLASYSFGADFLKEIHFAIGEFPRDAAGGSSWLAFGQTHCIEIKVPARTNHALLSLNLSGQDVTLWDYITNIYIHELKHCLDRTVVSESERAPLKMKMTPEGDPTPVTETSPFEYSAYAVIARDMLRRGKSREDIRVSLSGIPDEMFDIVWNIANDPDIDDSTIITEQQRIMEKRAWVTAGWWVDPAGKVYEAGDHVKWLAENEQMLHDTYGYRMGKIALQELIRKGWTRIRANGPAMGIETRDEESLPVDAICAMLTIGSVNGITVEFDRDGVGEGRVLSAQDFIDKYGNLKQAFVWGNGWWIDPFGKTFFVDKNEHIDWIYENDLLLKESYGLDYKKANIHLVDWLVGQGWIRVRKWTGENGKEIDICSRDAVAARTAVSALEEHVLSVDVVIIENQAGDSAERYTPDEAFDKYGSLSKQADLETRMPSLIQQHVSRRQSTPQAAEAEIRALNTIDPTGDKASYTPWILNQALKDPSFNVDIAKTVLTDFHDKQSRKLINVDINQYDLNSLKSLLTEHEEDVSGKEVEREQKQELGVTLEDYGKILLNEGGYIVLRIDDPKKITRFCKASGTGTTYCIHEMGYAETYAPVWFILQNGSVVGVYSDEDEILSDRQNQKSTNEEHYMVLKKVLPKINIPISIIKSPAALQELARDKDVDVRWGVAENPNTPTETLQELARDKDVDVRWGVAENPSTPPAALQELARDTDEYVRYHVAQNPNTPPEALQELARDADEYVCYWVAHNPSTPSATLQELARDKDVDIRWGVAQNPNTPPAALQELARDEDWNVRWGVAHNPSTPLAALQELARDEDTDVATFANEELKKRTQNKGAMTLNSRKYKDEYSEEEGGDEDAGDVEGAADAAEDLLTNHPLVAKVVGIGSFYNESKDVPPDVDYFVVLNVPFENDGVSALSDSIESLKNEYRNDDGDTLVNIFMEDSNGHLINSVDLFFAKDDPKNFSLEQTYKGRKEEMEDYREDWECGKILK